MSTTTVRVDTRTHARLLELATASERSLVDTVDDAVEALSRQRFALKVRAEIAELRADAAAWTDYLADAEATSVTDGLG